jgi:16S rRNA (guanine527-N7)-methyltransferase
VTDSRGGQLEFGSAIRTALEGVCMISEEQCSALREHFELLLRWNRRMNLTSIRDPLEMIERHYCESVFLGMRLPEVEISVVDVGSGAGFPGIGVAVMRRLAQVTLVESNQKKVAFLKESTRKVGNIRVLGGRAEDVRERFDWLISRAVAWEALPMLGDRVALLASEPAPEFPWRECVRLPWGDRRVLLIGDVPRGTTK